MDIEWLRGENKLESPGATRRRQGVERAKTLVIFVNSIKTSRAIKYWQLIIPKSDVYEKDEEL